MSSNDSHKTEVESWLSRLSYINDVPSLSAYIDSRILSAAEQILLMPFIQAWADSYQMDKSQNFSTHISIKEAMVLYKARVHLHTRLERRKVELKDKPFINGDTESAVAPVDDNAFPLWSYDVGLKSKRGLCEEITFEVPKAGVVKTCTACHGQGSNTCPACNGEKQLTCPKCGGTGKNVCGGGKIGAAIVRGFIGHGQIIGGGCGGSGVVNCWKCHGSGMVDNHMCPACLGRQVITCKKCGGKGEVKCTTCNTSGQVTCKTCNGNGRIQCSSCEGHRKMLTCYYIHSKEEDVIGDATIGDYKSVPDDVSTWLKAMGERRIATHEFECIQDSFLSKYDKATAVKSAITKLWNAARANETGKNDGELINVAFKQEYCRIKREWLEEYCDVVCRVTYDFEGMQYTLWLSMPCVTPNLEGKHKNLVGHDHWREGTFAFASLSPFTAAQDLWQSEAEANFKRGDVTKANDTVTTILSISPENPRADALRRRIYWYLRRFLLIPAAMSSILLYIILTPSEGGKPRFPQMAVLAHGSGYVLIMIAVATFILLVSPPRKKRTNILIGLLLGSGVGLFLSARNIASHLEERRVEETRDALRKRGALQRMETEARQERKRQTELAKQQEDMRKWNEKVEADRVAREKASAAAAEKEKEDAKKHDEEAEAAKKAADKEAEMIHRGELIFWELALKSWQDVSEASPSGKSVTLTLYRDLIYSDESHKDLLQSEDQAPEAGGDKNVQAYKIVFGSAASSAAASSAAPNFSALTQSMAKWKVPAVRQSANSSPTPDRQSANPSPAAPPEETSVPGLREAKLRELLEYLEKYEKWAQTALDNKVTGVKEKQLGNEIIYARYEDPGFKGHQFPVHTQSGSINLKFDVSEEGVPSLTWKSVLIHKGRFYNFVPLQQGTPEVHATIDVLKSALKQIDSLHKDATQRIANGEEAPTPKEDLFK